MDSRFSSFSSTSTYSHLLYLNDTDRACYLSGSALPKTRTESISFFSMSSSRTSSESERSTSSQISTSSTRHSSVDSTTIPSYKYADDHYPLITSIDPSGSLSNKNVPQKHMAFTVARQMAALHNTIIRALNSSYNHAISIKPATQACSDFIKYNQMVFNTIEHHHHVEESFLFGALEELLEQPGAMEENVQQHEAFMAGLHKFQEYVFDEQTVQNFNGVKLRKLIESFAPDLIQHLHDEIPTLVNLRVADSNKLKKIWVQAHKVATQDSDLHVDGPFLLGCQDKSFLLDGEPIRDFPGMPWFIEALIRKWFARKHANVWAFLPSDLFGTRRVILV